MKNRAIVTKGLLVALLLSMVGVWAARRADAIIIINSRGVDTGMFGITASQTARVHVLNASGFSADDPPCIVEVRFFEAGGALLSSRQIKVVAGRADFVDHTDLTLRTGERKHIRAVVVQMLLPDFEQPAPVCIVTAEVFESRTGQAGIIIVNSHPVR
jgi:hypothetical protein